MHQHLIAHPRLGQAGQAHPLAHTTEIHLSRAPEVAIPIGRGRVGDGTNLPWYGQAHGLVGTGSGLVIKQSLGLNRKRPMTAGYGPDLAA